jgi:hypothetical protein
MIGDRHVNYGYDKVGRLNSVNDSKLGVASYDYQTVEDDIRLTLDDRTRPVMSPLTQINTHNQNQTALKYTRQYGNPLQAIVWQPAQGQFSVARPTSPMEAFQSSKLRRRLFDAWGKDKKAKQNFDKPSSSFFTPTEYQIINCDIEDDEDPFLDCLMYGVIMDSPSMVNVGQSYTFSAFAIGGFDCIATYTFLVDNTIVATNTSGLLPFTFITAGNHSIRVLAECSCGGYPKWDIISVDVQDPNSCPASANSAAVPVNFTQLTVAKPGNGFLVFFYGWGSSTGKKEDLKGCTIGEYTTYPGLGSGTHYSWPKPPWSSRTKNPTELETDATADEVADVHFPGTFVKPYREAEFTAQQSFFYRCPCVNGGNKVTMKGPHPVKRMVTKSMDGTYRYTIKKSGETAVLVELP